MANIQKTMETHHVYRENSRHFDWSIFQNHISNRLPSTGPYFPVRYICNHRYRRIRKVTRRSGPWRCWLPCSTLPGTWMAPRARAERFGSDATPSERSARCRGHPGRWWKPGLLAMPWKLGKLMEIDGWIGVSGENRETCGKLMFCDVFLLTLVEIWIPWVFAWVECWKERKKQMEGKE